MNRRRFRQFSGLAVAVALGAFALWLENESNPVRPRPGPPPESRSDPRRPSDRAAPAVSSDWQELTACRLGRDSANDGDSFKVTHGGGEHTVRLYFVDCCEKRRHQYNGQRIAEQGAYFGGLSEAAVVRLGREARDGVLKLLAEHRFAVFTRWDKVYDSDRYYAHVRVILPDGKARWLSEWLVGRGLARLHTLGADLPDGTRARTEQGRLRTLEKDARLARRGGWANFESRERPE